MADDSSLFEFPCDFPIKIIGKNEPQLIEEIITITKKHFPDLEDEMIRTQQSGQSNYLAVTITLYVLERSTLDSLYIELTAHPDIKMVL